MLEIGELRQQDSNLDGSAYLTEVDSGSDLLSA